FATGEPHGTGKGVGHASIHAKPVMESQGTLRDMWNAMLYHSKRLPEVITAVEWFTFDDGYQRDIEPKLVGVPEFTEKELLEGWHEITTAIRTWPYVETNNKSLVRGILVARLTVRNQYVYILEIQRRPRRKKDSDGQFQDSEETFQGFVFTLK